MSVAKAAPATPTKMVVATEIYKRMRKDVTRKDIIDKFVAEVKLTKAGAAGASEIGTARWKAGGIAWGVGEPPIPRGRQHI